MTDFKKYPFERLVPEGSDNPDVLLDHILKISFLSDRVALKQQARMQEAEEYAIQQCQIQCKRDGRMKREKDDENDGKMRLNQTQLLAKMEHEMKEKGMTKEEKKRLEQTKAFHAALEAIPWTELNEPDVAEVVEKKPDDGQPKPFLKKSIFNAPREMTEAESAELKFDVDRGVAILEGTEDDDVDDKVPRAATVRDDEEESAAPVTLRPAIPEDAVAPEITQEMLALDPDNPEIVPQPIKERENRFSYAAKFGEEFDNVVANKNATEEQVKQVLRAKKAAHEEKWKNEDPNVAGFVADGSAIPIVNEGALARSDLPPVYRDGPAQRAKVLGGKYDPALDKPFLWHKNFRYIVVSMMGPDCPQQAPRRLFRVWGGVKTEKEGKDLMDEVVKKNIYGSWWRTYLYSIQRWIAFPPKGQTNDKGTVMEGNNEYAEYQQSFMDHSKHVLTELEQRAMDTKAGEKTAGQSIIEQLKQKNLHVNGGVDASMIPRSEAPAPTTKK